MPQRPEKTAKIPWRASLTTILEQLYFTSLIGSEDIFHLAVETLERMPWTSPLCAGSVFSIVASLCLEKSNSKVRTGILHARRVCVPRQLSERTQARSVPRCWGWNGRQRPFSQLVLSDHPLSALLPSGMTVGKEISLRACVEKIYLVVFLVREIDG